MSIKKLFIEPEPEPEFLRNSSLGCKVSGFFVISYLRILVRHQLLDPNLYGKAPKGHAGLKGLLSRLKKGLLSDDISESTQSNLFAEEWKVLIGLAADKTIVIKGTDKGS